MPLRAIFGLFLFHDQDETKRDEPKPRKNSDSSHSFNGEFSDDEEEEEDEEDPAQFALPTFLMAGTIFGAIFRVDLTKVKVDVETNDLSETDFFSFHFLGGGVRIQ